MRIGLMRDRSAAVKMRPRASRGTEIDLIRAWAWGLRTKATSIVPGSLMSGTNSPRPCRCRSSSLRSREAPIPYPSLAMPHLLGDLLRGLGARRDDVGVAGAAADIAGKALADLTLRASQLAADQVARGDQHRRRAKPALQRVVLMEVPAQRGHHCVAGEAFDGFDGTVVAGDR